jgi:hypothetical protein
MKLTALEKRVLAAALLVEAALIVLFVWKTLMR